ncbi:MAG: DEAD/DEAH box helicase family protein, partial [Cyanobacteria bacterium P01_A01_bin.17]
MPNFRFPEDDFSYGRGGPKTKARANIQAIELLKELEAENRSATLQEQETLAQYVGWGGIPQIFNPTPDPDWSDLAQQLKGTLEPEEWDSALESTLNAHYTSPEVITEIYRGLEHLGFKRGKILEPSMGTGNFIGLMPERMAQRSEVTGIELDQITGQIAKQLYPDAKLHVRGFEETPLPENYFDLAISNVPFGDYKIKDPEYNHLDLQIHNYFFARSLDRVRPGGLVTFVTSTGTLQSKSNQTFREWLAERSNLVGAMRLPGNAFKQTAGTEVTTDLIILQKHGPTVAPAQQPWANLADTTVQDAEGNYLQTNEYYAQYPERMLGELCDDKLYPGRLALRSDGKDLAQAMGETFESFPADIFRSSLIRESSEETLREPLPKDSTLKNYGYFAQGEQIWQRQGNWLNLTEFKGKRAERISGMLDIRDAVQDVFAIQIRSGTDEELESAQVKLNQVYDQFIGKHGLLSASANSRVFKLDPDAQLLLALEQENNKTGAIEKAAVFSKRTVRSTVRKEKAETPQEALLISLNEYGTVVPDYMGRLLNQDEASILADLKDQGLIFKDPQISEWQTQDQYLSGNVRQKLRDAEQAAADNPEFATNVAALEEVQPRDLGPGEIEIRLGAPWIPTDVIRDFAQDLLEVEKGVDILHSVSHATWAVTASPSIRASTTNTTTYGTADKYALELIESSLNLKDATVYATDGEGKRYVVQDSTLSARMKQQQIQERFKGWVWQDLGRAEQLCDRYNNLFNEKVIRQFKNPKLEMPGSNPEIELRSHQKDGVWRALQSDTALFAHVVGSGKTFTMAASAIEMRRLGIAKKPMIVVPNHMLRQFTRELQQLYPNAKVLAATENDSKASKRKELMARIATGDWDAVIVTHSAFTRLPISKSQEREFYQAQKDELDQLLGVHPEAKHSNAVTKMLARE